ncbi:hypothetical protein F5ESL0245_07245 [Lactobacillus sp. ESL0245]|nr:hypothetical protein F5ESL0247_07245 [Lactobacillus sp. ESL0247]RMC27495.1 hypothetical protein F5ESL0246_07245 [Lactobacillus sp. ESL0246]RMC30696.1 hypothetical protein F5ESL0245_07245 [Lactobacillus sp. ESL0245]
MSSKTFLSGATNQYVASLVASTKAATQSIWALSSYHYNKIVVESGNGYDCKCEIVNFLMEV